MRTELKSFDWHYYGIDITDFENIVRLTKDIFIDRQEQLEIKIKNILITDDKGNYINDSETKNEVESDLRYYTWIENYFLWHFCLWRLQGLFKGLLKQKFFPNLNLSGLKAKLDFLINQNYIIESDDYNEIVEWGKLRNALSHAPPESNRQVCLDELDIIEYLELIKRIANNLQTQSKNKLPLT